MGAFRRSLVAFVALLVAATACTPEPEAAPAEPEQSTTTTSTSSTTTSTTTTVPPAPPMAVAGVPDELARLIESMYEHAAGTGGSVIEPRYLPEAGIATGMAGRTATGGVADLGGTGIALVQAGEDLIAAVDDGEGWRVVAADLPTLDHRDLGYTSAVIAAVGSDARPGEDGLRSRADSLHLIGFDGVAGTFDVVGIPRDSWVPIAGRGAGKINSALSLGGPATMIATLEQLVGYPLDGTLITGFVGFQEAVGNVLGGIQITVDAPMRDSASGANFQAGEQYMNGSQALAFARARKTLLRGDFDRQRNGGLVLIAAAFTARHRPIEDAPRLVAEALDWAWTDMAPDTVLRLVVTSLVAPILDVRNEVADGVARDRSGASVVELTGQAHVLFTDLADGALD
ncbi:MAG TPA: LCP family protein [Acidimicrobiia bacterium]|nr:LCP family protein [Acidimicrobiia bacterium]